MKKEINYSEKFFIAGSTGMVGSSIIRKLRKKGYGDKDYGGEILAPNRNELNLLDLLEVQNWFELNKPSVVILAAAKVGGIMANASYPFDFIFENLRIQNNVIETAWLNNVKRFVFLGSSCIYPKFAQQPISEDSLLTGELEKTNEPYAIAKISGIKLCESLRKQYGFDAISLMPTNLFGPKDNYHPQNSHVMASFIKKFCEAKKYNKSSVTCWGSGKPKREFMHVDDLSEAIVFCLEKWNPSKTNSPKNKLGYPLNFLNVGTGEDISISSLSEIISKEVGYQGKVIWDQSKPDGTPKKQLNIEKIKSLGWSPKIKLIDGIAKTVVDFKTNYIE